MDGVGSTLEMGVEAIGGAAKTAVEGTAQITSEAANLGSSIAESAAPLATESTMLISSAAPIVEAGVTTEIAAQDIGTRIGETASSLVGAQTAHADLLRAGDEAAQSELATQIAQIRGQLDELMLERMLESSASSVSSGVQESPSRSGFHFAFGRGDQKGGNQLDQAGEEEKKKKLSKVSAGSGPSDIASNAAVTGKNIEPVASGIAESVESASEVASVPVEKMMPIVEGVAETAVKIGEAATVPGK